MSSHALDLTGFGECSFCGKFRVLWGKRKRLCHECANEQDYWTSVESEAASIAADSLDWLLRKTERRR